MPCLFIEDLTEAQKRAYILADNKLALEAGWDEEILKIELQALRELDFDITLTGFELEDINIDEPIEIIEDEFSGVEEDAETITKLGDIWQLGRHRLMCGDSTSIDDVERLMDGEKADISFTSPPYNAGSQEYYGKTESKYENDSDDKSEQEYRCFLNEYLHNAILNSQYVFCNIQSLAGNKIALIDFLFDNKKIYADTMIWDKQYGQPAMAKNVMNSAFEYIHIFSKKANRNIGTIEFRGTIDNVLRMNAQRNNEYSSIHNATFSVEFASHFVKNFAKESVLDLFGGTGTTLMSCEQLNKKCFMMELDPKYCDVIIKRWETFTGQKAKLITEQRSC